MTAPKAKVEYPPFIAFDWCGFGERYGRYTHMPSGDTLVQRPDMDQIDWDEAMRKFFAKYPDITVYVCLEGPYRPTEKSWGTTQECIERIQRRRGG